MSNRSVRLTPPQQDRVLAFIHDRMNATNIQSKRQRYAVIDKAIQLESERRRMTGRDQRLDYMDDVEIGLISPAIDTIQGFLVDLYLGQTPIFPVISNDKNMTSGVTQFNTILEQEEKDFAWGRQMAVWFRALAKYNLGAIECEWTDRVTSTIAGSITATQDARITNVAVSGNKMGAIDMYNLFYDEQVAPADVHETGEFIAKVEICTMVRLAQIFADLEQTSGNVMNKAPAYRATTTSAACQYYEEPSVVPERAADAKSRGWKAQFDSAFSSAVAHDPKATSSTSVYEVVTFYARIIPSMFGIKSPGGDNVQIYKFVVVGNKHIVYAEHQNNVHGYFPIVLGQLREENLKEQTKSPAELLAPLQNLSTKLYDARLASLARAVGDRLAYVSGVIDDKEVKSQSPVSRISMRPNALYKDIRSAIYQIPFQDSVGASFINELNHIRQVAQDTTRMNRPQLGQFQKGNKTLGEFNTVMRNSQQELRIMGILLENQCLMPLKNIIKSNVLQYQKATQVMRRSTGQPIAVNPEEIRKSYLDFKLADGLQNQEELLDVQLVREFMQVAQADPEVRQGFDVPGLLVYLFEMSGAKIAQFRRELPPQAPTPPTPPTQ